MVEDAEKDEFYLNFIDGGASAIGDRVFDNLFASCGTLGMFFGSFSREKVIFLVGRSFATKPTCQR